MDKLCAEAQQEVNEFEAHNAGAQYHIQEIWEYDLMPDKTVVDDFYKTQEFGQLQKDQALWERISENCLDDVVPGENFQAQAQWRVTLPGDGHGYSLTWMIYQWWDGDQPDDDIYLYENITPPDDFGPGSEPIQRETIKRIPRED